jgi:hypothetical protein
MASTAASNFARLSADAKTILKAGSSGLTRREKHSLLGAAFLANVAAWNSYVVTLVPCIYKALSDPVQLRYSHILSLLEAESGQKLGKFNTPNAENTRNLLMSVVGYDPWQDWSCAKRGLNALAARERLNEILKVRHSLAHGFSMPSYKWNQSASGDTRLTLYAVNWSGSFLSHLVMSTDAGIADHIKMTHGLPVNW